MKYQSKTIKIISKLIIMAFFASTFFFACQEDEDSSTNPLSEENQQVCLADGLCDKSCSNDPDCVAECTGADCMSDEECGSDGYCNEECNSDMDCDPVGCQGDACSGDYASYGSCDSDDDCWDGLCVDGRCIQCIEDQDCTGEAQPYCFDGFCRECLQDDQCPEGICINHFCEFICSNDDECFERFGAMRPHCGEGNICHYCSEDAHCDGEYSGHVCLGGACVDCVVDSDCDHNQVCDGESNLCYHQEECASDDDCAALYGDAFPYCYAGEDEGDRNYCVFCTDSSQCSDGGSCTLFECKIGDCDTDEECAEDNYGFYPYCVDHHCEQCREDSDCNAEEGEFCTTYHACIAPECGSDEDCGGDTPFCIYPGFCFGCRDDSDCEGGRICNNFNYCACTEDEHCANYWEDGYQWYCKSNSCKECLTDEHCQVYGPSSRCIHYSCSD